MAEAAFEAEAVFAEEAPLAAWRHHEWAARLPDRVLQAVTVLSSTRELD